MVPDGAEEEQSEEGGVINGPVPSAFADESGERVPGAKIEDSCDVSSSSELVPSKRSSAVQR